MATAWKTCDDCQNVSNFDQRDSIGDRIADACDGDLDDNGVVSSADLARMKAASSAATPTPISTETVR